MRNEGSAPLQKKGKGKLADLLADLLGYGGTSGEPGTKTNKLNLYESMASTLGRELRSQQPVINCELLHDLNSARQGDKGTIIYENCFKCKKGEECHPPPWGTPAFPRNSFVLQVDQMHHSGVCFGQPLPSEPLKNSVDCEKTSNEEQPIEVQLLDRTLQDGDLPCLEVKDHSVSVEGKRTPTSDLFFSSLHGMNFMLTNKVSLFLPGFLSGFLPPYFLLIRVPKTVSLMFSSLFFSLTLI